MKKLKSLAFFTLFLSALSFTSCDGDIEPLDPALADSIGDGGGSAAGVFKVDFDGSTFVATTTQAIVNADYMAITGMKAATGQMFQITLNEAPVEGTTYTWGSFTPTESGMALAYIPATGNVPYLGASDETGTFADYPEYIDTAELTITDIDTANETITGTFKFTGVRFNAGLTAVETKVFTNGSFNLSYGADVTPTPTGNSFFAKLDGADFNPTNITGVKASGNISIIGRRGSIENIGLTLPDNVTPGTYELDFFAGTHVGLYVKDNTGTGAFGSDTGSVTITTHDVANKKIIGTFNFVATSFIVPDEYEITNGTFNITYQ